MFSGGFFFLPASHHPAAQSNTRRIRRTSLSDFSTA